MRFVRPFRLGQGAREQPLPHMADGGIIGEETDRVVGHGRALEWRPDDDRAGYAVVAARGADCRTPSSTWSANCAKFSTNRSTSVAAVASYSALFAQASRGSRMAGSTPATLTGTMKPKLGSLRNSADFR